VQRVVAHLKAHHLRHRGADMLDAGVAEFHHFSACGADHMVVLAEAMGALELGLRTTEAVLAHQLAIEQQVHGVVKGSAAHAVFLALHAQVEPLNIEVAVLRVDLVKDGETLRRFAVALQFQVVLENMLHVLLDVCGRHGGAKVAFAGDGGRIAKRVYQQPKTGVEQSNSSKRFGAVRPYKLRYEVYKKLNFNRCETAQKQSFSRTLSRQLMNSLSTHQNWGQKWECLDSIEKRKIFLSYCKNRATSRAVFHSLFHLISASNRKT